jgi:osmotically-inducible protein OsmY
MSSDSAIQTNVERELRWDPDIDATDVAVAVKNGVVTLSGYVRSYAQKLQAEQDAKRITGVAAVANDIEVRLPYFNQRPDPEIARDAVAALQRTLPYSSEHITVTVEDRWVTLEGDVEWNYQRERAERAVERVRGTKGVINLITLKPRATPFEIRQRIEDALKRRAAVDATSITVETNGSEVTLRGRVRSWAERHDAERAAWAAPGVTRVENRLRVAS